MRVYPLVEMDSFTWKTWNRHAKIFRISDPLSSGGDDEKMMMKRVYFSLTNF